MPNGGQRLEQQAIHRVVNIAERSQVDFAVPAKQQLEEGRELIRKRGFFGFPKARGLP